MPRCKLSIYYGPDEESGGSQGAKRDDRTVTVPLGDIFPALADAVATGKMWVRDFAEDEITISSDLYEIILAYEHYRRPSA